MPIQIYINGHEWLARKLEANGIRYTKYENALSLYGDGWSAALNGFFQRIIDPSLFTRLECLLPRRRLSRSSSRQSRLNQVRSPVK